MIVWCSMVMLLSVAPSLQPDRIKAAGFRVKGFSR